jgi:hypothetical protein
MSSPTAAGLQGLRSKAGSREEGLASPLPSSKKTYTKEIKGEMTTCPFYGNEHYDEENFFITYCGFVEQEFIGCGGEVAKCQAVDYIVYRSLNGCGVSVREHDEGDNATFIHRVTGEVLAVRTKGTVFSCKVCRFNGNKGECYMLLPECWNS